jgi:HAD superfamily hydrolase (TIGR01549 family)
LTCACREVEQESDAELIQGGREAARIEFWRRVLVRATHTEVTRDAGEKLFRDLREREPPVRLFPDVLGCLNQLRLDHRVLGVISNSTSEASIRRMLEGLGILDYFAQIVSSGTEGVAKPNPEIFRRSLQRMDLRPEEAFYVGNLIATDARGAAEAGLHSAWLNRESPRPAESLLQIGSLLEIPGLVAALERDEQLK